MARRKTNNETGTENDKEPRSVAIARKGIKTSDDFANLMSSLMSDLIEGKVAASVGNATCNAGGKLLKMVDMTYKYGNPNGHSSPRKSLTIAESEPPILLDDSKE